MRIARCFITTVASLLVVVGCGPDAGVANPTFGGTTTGLSAATSEFSEWSAPVNLGPVINTGFNDLAPEMSKDGLSLYFSSNRPGFGLNDIYVSERASLGEPWGAPVNIGPVINTVANEAGAHISRDGHWLYFTSTRAGYGGNDLFSSWRSDVHDNFSWSAPENLGTPVNSAVSELGPSIWGPEFYFWRGTPGTNAFGDIYVSRMAGDRYDEPEPVVALNTAGHEEKPSVRFDGREIVITSRRVGSVAGSLDLWVSTRQGNGQDWSEPQNVAAVNTSAEDRRPTLSGDGTMLFFDSDRPGGSGLYDIYVATRTRAEP